MEFVICFGVDRK